MRRRSSSRRCRPAPLPASARTSTCSTARTEFDIGHIRLARDTDVVVVAPATADLMAKMAGGHADDLATTVLLATDKPVLIAPAMNPHMWMHGATKRNFARLAADGVVAVGPNCGEMAEQGEAGAGRMAEPLEIVAAVEALLARRHAGPLAGKHVLVTAGPTHEPIDPVRYIANRSSGKQGYAIAARGRGRRRGGDARRRSGGARRSARREGDQGGKRARHAGRGASVAAGRCRGVRRGGRGLAGRRGGRAEDQEDRRAAPPPRAGRKPRHSRDHRPAQIAAAMPRHRLCRGDRACDRKCPRQARAQGLRLDRRQRCLAFDRHHGGRPQHGAPDHRRGRRVLAGRRRKTTWRRGWSRASPPRSRRHDRAGSPPPPPGARRRPAAAGLPERACRRPRSRGRGAAGGAGDARARRTRA